MMKDKVEKVKTWTKEHSDDLWFAGWIAGYAAFYAGLGLVSWKIYKNQMAEWRGTQQELNDALSRGATVLPGPSGTWWILENQS